MFFIIYFPLKRATTSTKPWIPTYAEAMITHCSESTLSARSSPVVVNHTKSFFDTNLSKCLSANAFTAATILSSLVNY